MLFRSILKAHGPSINPLLSLFSLLRAYYGPFSLFHIIYCHGLLFLSFRTPSSPFTSSRPICLFHGPMIHYFYCLSLMGFLSVCQLFSICVAGPLPSTWVSKMAINTWKPAKGNHFNPTKRRLYKGLKHTKLVVGKIWE